MRPPRFRFKVRVGPSLEKNVSFSQRGWSRTLLGVVKSVLSDCAITALVCTGYNLVSGYNQRGGITSVYQAHRNFFSCWFVGTKVLNIYHSTFAYWWWLQGKASTYRYAEMGCVVRVEDCHSFCRTTTLYSYSNSRAKFGEHHKWLLIVDKAPRRGL